MILTVGVPGTHKSPVITALLLSVTFSPLSCWTVPSTRPFNVGACLTRANRAGAGSARRTGVARFWRNGPIPIGNGHSCQIICQNIQHTRNRAKVRRKGKKFPRRDTTGLFISILLSSSQTCTYDVTGLSAQNGKCSRPLRMGFRVIGKGENCSWKPVGFAELSCDVRICQDKSLQLSNGSVIGGNSVGRADAPPSAAGQCGALTLLSPITDPLLAAQFDRQACPGHRG